MEYWLVADVKTELCKDKGEDSMGIREDDPQGSLAIVDEFVADGKMNWKLYFEVLKNSPRLAPELVNAAVDEGLLSDELKVGVFIVFCNKENMAKYIITPPHGDSVASGLAFFFTEDEATAYYKAMQEAGFIPNGKVTIRRYS